MKNNLIISNKFMVMSLCFVAYFSTIAAMEPLQQRLCKRSEVPGELVVEKKIRLITPEEVALAEVQTTVKVLCDGVSRSSYSLVKFKPQGPGDYDNSQQFGLKVLDQGQEIGHIVYEAFSDEDEDADSDEEIDESCSKTGSIGELIVEKAYRKQNLGRRLLDKACQHLQALNCDSIVLVAAPEEKSMLQKLVGFYTKAGFRVENKEDLPKIVASSDDNPAVPMYKKLRK
jgi:ribosomal protein S18 acetylase RimI-like enzyme